MPHLTPSDWAAFGAAVMMFGKFENMLIRLSALNYDPNNGLVDRDAAHRAVKTPLTRLVEELAERLGTIGDAELVRMYFTASTDEHGRRRSCQFITWRNALCHGDVTKLDNGNLWIEFHDRETFGALPLAPHLVHQPLTKETNAKELTALARSIGEVCIYIIEAFGMSATEADAEHETAAAGPSPSDG